MTSTARVQLLLGTVALTLAASSASLRPQVASACGIPEPTPGEFHGSTPSNGETHPANAVLLFRGKDISLAAVTVAVDGEAAALVPDSEFPAVATIVARVEPAPVPGQVVTIDGPFCGDCGTSQISYTVGEPDDVAPAAVEALTLSLHDVPDVEPNDGLCEAGLDYRWWVGFEALPAVDGAWEYVHLTIHDPAAPEVFVSEWYSSPRDEPVSTSQRDFLDELAGGDPGAACVRAERFDLSGNRSEAVESCGLCQLRVDMSEPYAEPAWTVDDIVAGGPCDLGEDSGAGTDSGSGGGDDEGCGCRSGGERRGAPLSLALALAFLVSARRRRRRRS